MKNITSIKLLPASFFFLLLVPIIICLDFSQEKCEIKLNKYAAKTFKKLLRFRPQWIEFQLTFSGLNVSNLTRPIHFDELSNPKIWQWTVSHQKRQIKFHYYYDSDIYTLGLINTYKKSMYVNFEVPDICRTTGLDRKELFRQIYGKIKHIVIVNKSFQSLICHEVNLCKSFRISSPVEYRVSRYFGMMRLVHAKRCCNIGRWDNSTNISNIPWDCPLHLNYKHLDIINVIGAVIFAFSPCFILKLFLSRTDKWILLDNGTFHEIRDNDFDWLKPDDNLPIFFWSMLRTLTRIRLNSFIRRVFRIVFILFTPIVLYIIIIIYYIYKYNELLIYLTEGLPIGYLSIIIGFRRSFENLDGFVGGPIIFLSIYYFVGIILVSIPENISKAMSSHVIRQRRSCTFLQVNIEFLEKYGSVEIRRLYGFERVYVIIKARILMVINPSFWFVFGSVWLSRILRLTDYLQETFAISRTAAKFLLLFPTGGVLLIPLLLEACLCILYYSLPISFILFTVPKSYLVSYILPYMRSRQLQNRLTSSILGVCVIFGFTIFNTYSLYIFCVSFFVVSRFLIQLFSLMIINPEYSMYLVAILFCFYYIHGLGRQVIINYHQLLSISIQIVEKTQSEEGNLTFDPPFVLVSYASDKYMRSDIFLVIISQHFPLHYELAWVFCKASIVMFFLSFSLHILSISETHALTFYNSIWVFFTACLPKLLNVVHQRKFSITRLEKSIYRILKNSTSRPFFC